MLTAELENLIPVKTLISNSQVHIELFENKQGNLFLSSRTEAPAGTVYYATTPSLFCSFLQNTITLQTLFNATPSVFIQLSQKEKTALYSFIDIDIILSEGYKTFSQLTGNSTIEIWNCGCEK